MTEIFTHFGESLTIKSLDDCKRKKLLTEKDLGDLTEKITRSENPDEKERLIQQGQDLLSRAEQLHSNYQELLSKSPFEKSLHPGFLSGFLNDTRNLEEKAKEIEKLTGYIHKERAFNHRIETTSQEVKTCFENYYSKYLHEIDRETILDAAFEMCEIQASLNMMMAEKLLTPDDIKNLLKTWENCPPKRINEFKKHAEKMKSKAQKITQDYKKELKKFIAVVETTTPDKHGMGTMEADFYMFFSQESKTLKEKMQKLEELKAYTHIEQQTLKKIMNMSDIEKREYQRLYKQYALKMGKKDIIQLVQNLSIKRASLYYAIFKDNPKYFSEQIISQKCMAFSKLRNFDEQAEAIQKERDECKKIIEVSNEFFKLTQATIDEHQEKIRSLATAHERKRYLEALIKNPQLKTHNEKSVQETQPIKTSAIPEKFIPKAEVIQAMKERGESILIPHEFLESTAKALIAEQQETTKGKAMIILNIAYWTARWHEQHTDYKKSAEERAKERCEDEALRQEQESIHETVKRTNAKTSIALTKAHESSMQDHKPNSEHTHRIERINMEEFDIEKKERIEELYRKHIMKRGETRYEKSIDQYTLLNKQNKEIGWEQAQDIRDLKSQKLMEDTMNTMQSFYLGYCTSADDQQKMKSQIKQTVTACTDTEYALSNYENFNQLVAF